MDSPTQAIAEYIVSERYERLPKDVVAKVKRCILDSIGCQLGGYTSEPGRRMADLMSELGGRQDATVLGSGRRIAMPSAALANTYMANILDYDDTFRGHPGCTVIPPALAGAEMTGATGKDLIAAVAVGYEVHSHVCQAMHTNPENVDKLSGVANQTFGSVASASNLLSLKYESVCDALGIAGATAPVQSNSKTGGAENVPPTMKVGFYSCSSVGSVSSLMARSGVTGPHNILDGNTGFWRMIGTDECRFDLLTQGLGSEYEIENVAYKPYSCCRWFHSSIDALLSIMQTSNVGFKDIQEVSIRTKGGKANLEYMKNPKPENFVAAEFSLPYSSSVAASGLAPGPDWISPKTMRDGSILGLAPRVHCEFELKSSKIGKSSEVNTWPASVEVKSTGGKFSKTVEFPKGSPMNMMSDQELDAKFLRLATPVIGRDRALKAIEAVRNLERFERVGDVMSILNGR